MDRDDGLPRRLFAHVANCVELYICYTLSWMWILVNVSDRIRLFVINLPLFFFMADGRQNEILPGLLPACIPVNMH